MDQILDKMEVNFEQLLSAFPTPLLVMQTNAPHFTIVAGSDAHFAASKVERHNVIGCNVFDVFPPNPVDEGEAGQHDLRVSLERVINTGKPDKMGVQRYDIQKGAEYEIKYWTIINTPVFDENAEVKYIIQRVEDVTEYILLKRKLTNNPTINTQKDISEWEEAQAEILRASSDVKAANRDIKISLEELERNKRKLIEVNERLKELDQLKTDFFSNVSHEFRTPLTLMLSPLEELLLDNSINKQANEKLDIAYRNAIRLLKLVNTLLDFSRLEAGRTKAVYRPTNISKLTKELASHFDSAVKKSGIKLIINCPEIIGPVYLDADFYEKIVLNLISNAFKHTFEGSIEITLKQVNRGIFLVVRDTGVGIPGDQLPFIFERFHRVPNARARTHEGSGIGLSLVQELVKLHQGTIKVTSILLKGTTFRVFFPSGNEHLSEQQIEDAKEPKAKDAKIFAVEALGWLHNDNKINENSVVSFGKAQILLADDNADMRNYIKGLLEPHYNVMVVTNGYEALLKARLNKPDLILSDVMMPHMNGTELIQALRNDEQLKLTPVILLSARAGDEAKIIGLETGADDYLIKPFNAQELLTRIKTNLAMQKARNDAQEKITTNMKRTAKLKDQFISNMSHELRTPLNAIIGYSEMILKGMVNSAPMQHRFVENISTAGRHLLLLINDILDLSKIEAGKFTLYHKTINVRDFIMDIQSLLKELAVKNQVFLNFHIPPEIETLRADPVRLKQIMINLLNNAIKFNCKEGKVDVYLEKSQDNQWIICKVIDTGIGIAQDKIGELFTEFYQADNSSARSYEGTGLGLALTKKLINLHGGTISVDSRENIGSTFSFTLPMKFNEIHYE